MTANEGADAVDPNAGRPPAPPSGGASENAGVGCDDPWPGLASFTETQAAFFHGRVGETRELVQRIRREALTTLFGQSGLGKTSLLQAGTFPCLREEDLLPVPVRVSHADSAASPREQVRLALAAAITAAGIDAPPMAAGQALWEYFHRKGVNFWSPRHRLVTPVLVFDQFEEFFTVGRATAQASQRGREFLEELADLTENRAPQALKERLERGDGEASAYDFDRAACKVVLSLREDFLPDLEGLRGLFRGIVLNRMRLKPMNGVQAADAIDRMGGHLVEPGVTGRIVEFVAGAGNANEAAIESFVAAYDDGAEAFDAYRAANALGRLSGEPPVASVRALTSEAAGPPDPESLRVEPALLSVVCRELNARRREQGLERITARLLAGTRRGILGDFYERGVSDLPGGARRFIEDRLLTRSGYRDSVALENAVSGNGAVADADGGGLTSDQLDRLVSRRLLRLEERLGSKRVELTHDVLAAPVKASRDARREREAIAAAEDRVRRSASEARRRRRVLLAVIGVALAIIGALSVLSNLAVRQRNEARALRAAAEQSAHAAEQSAHAAARSAEDARDKLWNALVSQARAGRYSGLPGQRIDGLRAIADAARIRIDPVLRDEAIACMALPDLTEQATLKGNTAMERMCFDDTLHRYARSDARGNIHIYRRGDWGMPGAEEELMTLPGLGAPVGWALAFSPGGRYLCASYVGGLSRFLMWDLEAREAVFRIANDLPDDNALDFSDDGTAIAFGVSGGGVAVRSVASGDRLGSFKVPGNVERVRFDPTGRWLAIYTPTAGIQVRSAATGEMELTIGPPVHLSDMHWSHDGALLAAACDDDRLYVWDARTGQRCSEMQGNEGRPIRVQFTHGNDLLASGAWDGSVRLWEPHSGKLFMTVRGFDSFLQLSADDSLLAFSGANIMHVCRLTTSRECRLIGGVPGEDQCYATDVSPDGALLAAVHAHGVHIWNPATGRSLARLPGNAARSVFFSPDGRWLFSSGRDGLRRWPVPVPASTLPADALEADSLVFAPPTQLAPASDAAALSADGHTLVFDSGGGNVCAMDVREPEKVTRLGEHPGALRFIAVSPDGRWAATSARHSNAFKVWDLTRHGPPVDLPTHGNLIDTGNASFTADGRRLVAIDPVSVCFWDVGTWSLHHQFSQSTIIGSPLLALAADGKTVAVIGPGFSTILLDAETGQTLATLMAPQPNAPGWIGFSPKGGQLVVAGGKGVFTVWDLKLLRQQLTALNLNWNDGK